MSGEIFAQPTPSVPSGMEKAIGTVTIFWLSIASLLWQLIIRNLAVVIIADELIGHRFLARPAAELMVDNKCGEFADGAC